MLTKKIFFDRLGTAYQTHFFSMNNPRPEPVKVYVTKNALTKRKAFAIRSAEKKLQKFKNLEFSFTEC